jgi:hypothetical protein
MLITQSQVFFAVNQQINKISIFEKKCYKYLLQMD